MYNFQISFSEWIWSLARATGQPGCEYKYWPDKTRQPNIKGHMVLARPVCDNVDARQAWINLVHPTKKRSTFWYKSTPIHTNVYYIWLDIILAQSSRQEKEQEAELKAGGRGGSRRVKSRNASNRLSSSSLHPGGSLHRSLIVDGAQVVPAMKED